MPIETIDISTSGNHQIDGRLLSEDASIFRLATAQLGIIEEAPSSRFHLRFTLCCDTGELTGVDAQYEVNLRQCRVEITTEGCDVCYSDAYSHQLSENETSIIYSGKTVAENTERSEIGGGGAKIKFSWVDWASIAFTGKISQEKLFNNLQKLEIKGKQHILLIGFHGTHWTVGHDVFGDPRHPEGWLHERYFHEDAEKPFCTIDVKEGAAEAKVTVAVRAKRGQLDVRLLDRTGRPSCKAGPEHVDDWSTALRERLRGMAVADALHECQSGLYPPLPASEFELTRKIVCATISKMPKADVSTPAPRADAEAKRPPRAKRRARKS